MRRWLSHIPRVEMLALAISLTVSIALMLIKFATYLLTGSAAVFADAMESTVNVAAATFASYALSTAHRPADVEHPYGHGKIEFVSAGFEGGMILVAAAVGLLKATESLVRGPSLHRGNMAAGVMLMSLALIANALTGFYLIRTGRTKSSMTLEADGRHLVTDALASAAVLVALVAVKLSGVVLLDPLAGAAVSLYIGWTGIGLVRKAAAGLMDEQDTGDTATLRAILDAHLAPGGSPPLICSYHKLRHRHTGRYHWVDFHIVVPRDWPVQQGHDVASAIEHEIEQALGEGDATAHVEPCVRPECSYCESARGSAAAADVMGR